jgi:hypothetical protein
VPSTSRKIAQRAVASGKGGGGSGSRDANAIAGVAVDIVATLTNRM